MTGTLEEDRQQDGSYLPATRTSARTAILIVVVMTTRMVPTRAAPSAGTPATLEALVTERFAATVGSAASWPEALWPELDCGAFLLVFVWCIQPTHENDSVSGHPIWMPLRYVHDISPSGRNAT